MGTSFEIRCKVGFRITKKSLVTVCTDVYIELALVYEFVLTWIFQVVVRQRHRRLSRLYAGRGATHGGPSPTASGVRVQRMHNDHRGLDSRKVLLIDTAVIMICQTSTNGRALNISHSRARPFCSLEPRSWAE